MCKRTENIANYYFLITERMIRDRRDVSNRMQAKTTQTLIPSTVQIKTNTLLVSDEDNDDEFGGDGWGDGDLDF